MKITCSECRYSHPNNDGGGGTGWNMSDLIERQAAIDEAEEWIEAVYCGHDEQRERDAIKHVINGIKKLPSAQPEIIHCRKCKFASGDSRICMKFGHSPIGELDFCAWAERRINERSNKQTGGY